MSSSLAAEASKPLVLIGALTILFGCYLASIVYTLFFSPYAKIPGPWINKISRWPYIIQMRNGTTVQNTQKLHAKYGPVVQLGPTDVSFTSIDSAWSQVYGFRTGPLKGHASHPKDDAWLGPRMFGVDNVLRAQGENHTRQRKLLSHAFSEKALNAQEELLQNYVDKLIEAMRKTSVKTGECINMVEYYNWTTFDIIGDLLFGRSFGNLDGMRSHDYVKNVDKTVERFSVNYMHTYFPWTKWLSSVFGNKTDVKSTQRYTNFIAEQTEQRMERETDRPDFMTFILQHNGEKGELLSGNEIKSNASLLIVAGSETTATLLSAVTWYLLKTPTVMEKLKAEMRGMFASYDDITLNAVSKAPYLVATLNEALRIFPPVPTGFPRVIAAGGEMVTDHYMPQGTSVCVSSYAAHHDPRNFADPDRFDPERWLGDEKYANDRRNEIQPFSFGPHACLGKNLAYGEMRLILAKLIWSFDLEMDSSAERWLDDCRVFSLWKKPALRVRVKDAAH